MLIISLVSTIFPCLHALKALRIPQFDGRLSPLLDILFYCRLLASFIIFTRFTEHIIFGLGLSLPTFVDANSFIIEYTAASSLWHSPASLELESLHLLHFSPASYLYIQICLLILKASVDLDASCRQNFGFRNNGK